MVYTHIRGGRSHGGTWGTTTAMIFGGHSTAAKMDCGWVLYSLTHFVSRYFTGTCSLRSLLIGSLCYRLIARWHNMFCQWLQVDFLSRMASNLQCRANVFAHAPRTSFMSAHIRRATIQIIYWPHGHQSGWHPTVHAKFIYIFHLMLRAKVFQ